MGFNPASHNIMLDAMGAVMGFVSAHTAAPGDAGANEVSGGAYARPAVAWNAAAASNLDSNGAPVINIPAATTITHLGFWSLASGGVFYGWMDITDEVFGSAGTYTCTDLDFNLVAV